MSKTEDPSSVPLTAFRQTESPRRQQESPNQQNRRRKSHKVGLTVCILYILVFILSIIALTFVVLYVRERKNCNGTTKSSSLTGSTFVKKCPSPPKDDEEKTTVVPDIDAIDKCSTVGKQVCHQNATCINTFDSFICSCQAGFYGNGSHCIEIDKCSTAGKQLCHENAMCINTFGSFICSCQAGFYGNGSHCIEIDKCSTAGKQLCHENAMCINTFGSFICSCQAGFYGNGSHCIEIDKCSTAGRQVCHENAMCINTFGSFICSCQAGFYGNGSHCNEIDKCSMAGKQVCHQNATCINTFGSFICSCQAGFYGNGSHCTDVNECLMFESLCHHNARCMNTLGSYKCSCKDGFSSSGTSCSDIDECSLQHQPCHKNATCTNTIGSYLCSCKTNYTGNGTHCFGIEECSNILVNGSSEPTYDCICRFEAMPGKGQNCEDSRFVLQYSGQQNDSHLSKDIASDMVNFSVCLWLQTNQTSDAGILSYFKDAKSSFKLYLDYGGSMKVDIGPVPYSPTQTINDGKWHHVCFTWSSNLRYFIIYIDGKIAEKDEAILQGETFSGGGDLVIGQYRDSSGTVEKTYSLTGKITQLHLWDKELTTQEIAAMYQDCSPSYQGNVISWKDYETLVHNNTVCERR